MAPSRVNIKNFVGHFKEKLGREDTWVISKILHTVRFLFKNEFISQNTLNRPSM